MHFIYNPRKSRPAFLAPWFGTVAIVLFLLLILLHRYGFITFLQLKILLFCCFVIDLVCIFCAGWGLMDFWHYGHRGGLKALRGLVYGLFLFIIFGTIGVIFLQKLSLYDSSTDYQFPPDFFFERSSFR